MDMLQGIVTMQMKVNNMLKRTLNCIKKLKPSIMNMKQNEETNERCEKFIYCCC